MLPPELEEIKEIPCYRVILKAMLKYQIQQLLKQLTEYAEEEEAIILSANLTDLTVSHLGTKHGKGFLDKYGDLKTKFLKFCLKENGGQPKALQAKINKKPASAGDDPNSQSGVDQTNPSLNNSSIADTDTADLMSMTANAIQQNAEMSGSNSTLIGNLLQPSGRLLSNTLPHLATQNIPPGFTSLQRNPYPFLQKRRRQKRMLPYQRPKSDKGKDNKKKENTTATMDEMDMSLQDTMIIANALGESAAEGSTPADPTETVPEGTDELAPLDAETVAGLTDDTKPPELLDVTQTMSDGENSNNGESSKDLDDPTKLENQDGSDEDDGLTVKTEKLDEEYDLFKAYLEGEQLKEGGASNLDPLLANLSPSDIPTIQQRVRSIQGKIAAAKRKDLTLAERQHALELLDQGYSTRIVAKMYGVGRSQIQNILHRRHEILTALRNEVPGSSTRIRFKSAINEDINKLLYEWYVEEVKDGSLLTGPQIQAKALDIATQLQKSDFKASNSWLQRFIKEYNIKLLFSRGAAVPDNWQIPTSLSPSQLQMMTPDSK